MEGENEKEEERWSRRGGGRVARRYYLRGKLQSEKNYVGPAALPRQRNGALCRKGRRVYRALAASGLAVENVYECSASLRTKRTEITLSATLHRVYDLVHLSSLYACTQACLLVLRRIGAYFWYGVVELASYM